MNWPYVLVFVPVLAMGCAHLEASAPNMQGAGWTAPLEGRHIGGDLHTLPNPREYELRQISSDGLDTPVAGDDGTVLADLSGPGSIVRLWFGGAAGRLAVYVDGEPEPAFNTPLGNLFLDSVSMFRPPIAGFVGSGCYSYVPIPFEESCRVVYYGDVPAPPYHITYADFENTTNLQSFSLSALNGHDKRYFGDWDKTWSVGNERRLHDPGQEHLHFTKVPVYPRKNLHLWTIPNPGVITEIEMEVGAFDPETIQQLWLAIFWDGADEPGVLAPLGGLFGSAIPPDKNYGGPVLGRDDNRMWLRFPMPFHRSAEVRLINASQSKVDFQYWITWRDDPSPGKYYFHARHNQAITQQGRPYDVARIDGRGHFVGCSLATRGADSHWYLAGGERVIIDGVPQTQLEGTSTGAYFNSAWDFGGEPFSKPTHGLTAWGNAPDNFHTAAYRIHFADAIPFDGSLIFQFDHGAGNNQPGLHYESVAFWYQEEPAHEAAVWPVALDVEVKRHAPPEWAGEVGNWAARHADK